MQGLRFKSICLWNVCLNLRFSASSYPAVGCGLDSFLATNIKYTANDLIAPIHTYINCIAYASVMGNLLAGEGPTYCPGTEGYF